MAVDISPFIRDAQKLQQETGIPASITLGQIILESSGKYAGGLSGLAVNGKNLFGVKGKGNGGSILMPTTEVYNGKPVVVQAAFRKYNTYYDSMVDHARVLSLPRYQKYLQNAKTVNDYAVGIKAGGYATDPQYSQKLLGVIGRYNLNQYDGGNLKYTPINNSSSSSATSSSTTSTTTATVEADKNKGMVETIFFHVSRIGMLLILVIVMILFFMKAFPAVENTVSTATNLIPQKKLVKGIKK